MSSTLVGILGLLTIIAIVVTLFKSKTQPAIAFIVWPTLLALVLVIGGRHSFDDIASMIKAGFNSTGPTAALFVFSVLYFGIMTDAGMFDVIIGKLMKLVGDNVVGVTLVTAIIALVGHLDGGGASTFCIVVPAMLPVYKRMHMRRTTLLRIAVLSMGVLNLMPWAGPTMRAASVLGMEAGSLWQKILPIQIFGIVLALAHAFLAGLQEKRRGAGLNGKLARTEGAVEVEEAKIGGDASDLARPKLFIFNICLTIACSIIPYCQMSICISITHDVDIITHIEILSKLLFYLKLSICKVLCIFQCLFLFFLSCFFLPLFYSFLPLFLLFQHQQVHLLFVKGTLLIFSAIQ